MTFDQRWVYAIAAVIAGFVVGAVLAGLARRLLNSPNRRPALHAIAGPTATFLFWLAAVTGVVTAIGFTSPDTLSPIPADILAWLPRALVAGLILLAGYSGGGAISATIAATVERATERRPAGLERTIRYGIMVAAVVLALGNLGVQTTSLHILIAAIAGSIGLAFALIAALGGQHVAANIASGRALRTELNVGDHIRTGDITGTITALRPTVAIINTAKDVTTVVPLARLLDEPFHITTATAAEKTETTEEVPSREL